MTRLDHDAISKALGSTIGPRVEALTGLEGAPRLTGRMMRVLAARRFKGFARRNTSGPGVTSKKSA